MTKLQIIARLWSHIYDLRLLNQGSTAKTAEEIEQEITVTERACSRFAECDDDELYALDVAKAAKKLHQLRTGGADSKER